MTSPFDAEAHAAKIDAEMRAFDAANPGLARLRLQLSGIWGGATGKLAEEMARSGKSPIITLDAREK